MAQEKLCKVIAIDTIVKVKLNWASSGPSSLSLLYLIQIHISEQGECARASDKNNNKDKFITKTLIRLGHAVCLEPGVLLD